MSQADNSGQEQLFDLRAVSAGASFRRVDLHIHTYGTSKDVADSAMLPTNIIRVASERGISLIAITDHNSIQAVREALDAAAGRADVGVIPGMEITTASGHVLALYPPDKLEELARLEHLMDFQTDNSGDRYTRIAIDKVADLITSAGGLCIPAHIDREGTGLWPKAVFHEREAVVQSPSIGALEIDDPVHATWFTAHDSGAGSDERRAMIAGRADKMGPVRAHLPVVMFSDAHQLSVIGMSRQGTEKVTRIKMDTPSFQGLRTALQDAGARVRLESDLPPSYPRILGVKFIGGFLDSQQITFSSSLTCLIGGRGTGKSTALDAMRWACSRRASSAMEGKENWPSRVQLCIEDDFGVRHWVTREAGSDEGPYEVIGGQHVPWDFDLEGYEQDEIATVVRGYDKEPRRLMDFIDQFVDLRAVSDELDEVEAALNENAKAYQPLRGVPRDLKTAKTAMTMLAAKIAAVDKTNAREALRWRRVLVAERALRNGIKSRLAADRVAIGELDLALDLDSLAKAAGVDDLTTSFASKVFFGPPEPGLKALLARLDLDLVGWQKAGIGRVDDAAHAMQNFLNDWEQLDQEINSRIAAISKELSDKGIVLDVRNLNQLAKEEETLKLKLKKLESESVQLTGLRHARQTLLDRYRQLQSNRFNIRVARAKALSRDLSGVSPFHVGVDFAEGALVEEYEAWLRAALGRQFIRGDRLAGFCRTIHPMDLAKAVQRADLKALMQLTDSSGSSYVDDESQASQFVAHLQTQDLMQLERIRVDDAPTISMTVEQDGQKRSVNFSSLSFGQKSSILLSLSLFSEATHPLVIDQPEDHLDSQFIYETVVKTLRQVKERRQIIVATHNGNIAILGDAELIVPLISWRGVGLVVDRGSVDNPPTRSRACKVLEGGEAAYKRRGQMYGFS